MVLGGHHGVEDGDSGGVRRGVENGGSGGDALEHGGSSSVTSRSNTSSVASGGVRKKRSSHTVTFLQSREIGVRCACATGPFIAGNSFANKQDMDLYIDKEQLRGFNRCLRNRKPIVDIIAIKDIVIVRSCGGLTATFSSGSSENIETVFHNKYQNSLMIVSSDEADGFTARQCRDYHVRYIWRKKVNTGSIFGEEVFTRPGFITFDELNGIALIRNKEAYRTFDLKTYSFKYEFSDTNVETVSCSPQVLLVRYKAADGQLHLEFKSVENGVTLRKIQRDIVQEKITCLDIINEKLLIKQPFKALQVVDLRSSKHCDVEIGDFMLQPLYGRNIFLSFQKTSTEVRDADGQLVRSFENHALSDINLFENKLCITRDQDIVISTCTTEGTSAEQVKVSSIDSGKLLCTVQPNVKITALCFNNDRKEIYVGTESGVVQVWSV